MNNPILARHRAGWQRLNVRLQSSWQALTLREKRMVGGMAVLLAGLFFWVVLIQPPLAKIAYWQAESPKLRAQAEALDVLLRDVGPRPAGQNLEHALQQTLQAGGLGGHYQLQAAPSGGWQLTFDAAPADAVLDWLLSRPRQFSLQVVEARLQRAGGAATDDTAGTLSGTVRMDQALGAKEAS